jgi:hypothetical protein
MLRVIVGTKVETQTECPERTVPGMKKVRGWKT